jgi:hypothetical protein
MVTHHTQDLMLASASRMGNRPRFFRRTTFAVTPGLVRMSTGKGSITDIPACLEVDQSVIDSFFRLNR